MKKLILIILFPLMSITISAQKSNPNYFHDLSGFEDSTGTTHLFYRLYEPKNRSCTYQEDGETYTVSINPYQNHIYHFNADTKIDSLFLKDYAQLSAYCYEIPQNIEKFILLNSNINKPITLEKSVYGLVGGVWLDTFDGNRFDIGLGNPLGLNYLQKSKNLLVTSPINEVVIKSNNGTGITLKKTYKLPLEQDSLWSGKNYYDDFPDSLLIDFSIVGVSGVEEDIFIGFMDSNLVISYDSGVSIETISENFLDEYPGFWGTFLNNSNSSAFYLLNSNSNYIKFGTTSDIIMIRRISEFNGYRWEYDELLTNSTSKRLAVDIPNPGNIYLSDSTKVFFSQDYGDTMEEMLEFEEEVTGLYKKPNSDILYVLTRTDLYKVENGQPTSIKQVPVSSKPEPEIPEKITLHQNYPNPFNPSTTIRFDLKESAFTKLTVYDLLGRKVKELVNEVRPAGTNTIQFNASDLASGVYLYRLEAGSYILTKRLTLIK